MCVCMPRVGCQRFVVTAGQEYGSGSSSHLAAGTEALVPSSAVRCGVKRDSVTLAE